MLYSFRLRKMSQSTVIPKIIKCRSDFGLGDSLINMYFFSKIAKYIESNNIIIYYYCKTQHHSNLEQFNSSANIKLLPYSKDGYHLYQGPYLPSKKPVNIMLCDMFNDFLRHHSIPIVIDKFEYDDADLLIKYVPSPISDIDILFINSKPKSSQFNHNKHELNQFIRELSQKYRVAVSEKLDDTIISLETNRVREIAALAKTVKKVIAINTGPSLGLYNPEIIQNVEAIYILDTTEDYNFTMEKFTKIRNVNELRFLLE